MALVQAWTGRAACSLQAALRMTNLEFAEHLGVAPRTVANWHEKPDVTPRAEMQQILDTAYENASASVKERFRRLTSDTATTIHTGEELPAHALKVAIAIVTNASDVLIVQRRGDDGRGITWQFPAGVVKPGTDPELVAVRETFAETGVHCSVVQHLGGRVHPITGVYCEYVLCDHLAGDPENKDIVENVSVTWVPKRLLPRFIPVDRIFLPVLAALEVPSEPGDS